MVSTDAPRPDGDGSTAAPAKAPPPRPCEPGGSSEVGWSAGEGPQAGDGDDADERKADRPSRPRHHHRRRLSALPLAPRIGIFVIGWTLLLVGIAGLLLPGIQGILTILAGAALLSLVSELSFNLLQRLMQRWPRTLRKTMAFRLKLHRRLSRRFRKKPPE